MEHKWEFAQESRKKQTVNVLLIN
ncbi:hypothetical protein AAFF39_01375 [Lactococcus garvieae]